VERGVTACEKPHEAVHFALGIIAVVDDVPSVPERRNCMGESVSNRLVNDDGAETFDHCSAANAMARETRIGALRNLAHALIRARERVAPVRWDECVHARAGRIGTGDRF